ncbi:MAG: hypothetical protein JO009_03415 [Candidatus Eremiobacteraeota bacterium]|nr:hypothetical protein [Candidatus Eremiobacteraeota bacterium]
MEETQRGAGWLEAPWDDPKLKDKIRNGDFASPTVKRWREDMEIIGKALSSDLQLHRQVYEELGHIIAANPRLREGNVFMECLFRWYVAHALVAIRREIDATKRTISLVRLLEEIKRNRAELTRRKHRLLHSGSEDVPPPPNDIFVTTLLDRGYDEFADATGDALDAGKIQADIDALKAATARLETYTNETITHRNRERATHPERFANEDPLHMKDVHDAIDVVEAIVKRYIALLTGAGYSTLNPVMQYDWTEIFTFAWRTRLPTNDDRRLRG